MPPAGTTTSTQLTAAKVVNGDGGTWWGNHDYSSRRDSDFMNLVESLNWTLYDFEAAARQTL